MISILMVGLGGALGAMCRYAIGFIPVKTEFPILTLLINLIGAIIIGFLVGFSSTKGMPEKWMLFLKTGVCGGFTTFSTFSLEALELFQNGKVLFGGIYVVCSVALCIVGVALGKMIALHIFKE